MNFSSRACIVLTPLLALEAAAPANRAVTSEQAQGIDQVNNAVTQMDDTTQQNAALGGRGDVGGQGHGTALIEGERLARAGQIQRAIGVNQPALHRECGNA